MDSREPINSFISGSLAKARSEDEIEITEQSKNKDLQFNEFDNILSRDISISTRSASLAKEEPVTSLANFKYKDKTYLGLSIEAVAEVFPTPHLPGKKPVTLFYHADGDYLILYQEIDNLDAHVIYHFEKKTIASEIPKINSDQMQMKKPERDIETNIFIELLKKNAELQPEFTRTGRQEKAFLKSLPELVQKLGEVIHNLAVSKIDGAYTQNQLTRAKFSYIKNISKKIGDLLADYLSKKYQKSFSKMLKDKTSQKILNSYLSGDETIELDDFKLKNRAFIKDFAQFAAYVEYDLHSGSKSQLEVTKYCQKLILQNLNTVFKALINSGKIELITSLKIAKLWPNLIISYRFSPKN